MERYIALLRGVNVGGNNPVPMARLKAAYERAGFSQVRTYINSGNVIFASEERDQVALKKISEQLILEEFGLDIAVAILSAKELAQALAGAPDWWGTQEGCKHNALFVIHPATPEEIMAQVGEINPDYEKLGSCGQVIFWSAPIATFSKVRWIKIVSSAAYQLVTIRNSNTARKLLALVG